MSTVLFFFSFQQIIYGLGWLVGGKLIPEIKKSAIWLSAFAFLCAVYFLISPKPSEAVGVAYLAMYQGIAVIAFMIIRKANEILFSMPEHRYEDVILALLFIVSALFTGIGIIPHKMLLIVSSLIVLWISVTIVRISYSSLLKEFGISIALFVIAPISLFIVIKTLQTIAFFFDTSWLVSVRNGALSELSYIGFLLIVTGLLHVGYVVILLKRLILNLEHISKVDKLTDIFNRRAAEEIMKHQMCASLQHNRPLSVLMVDIDYFKRVNDRYGHAQGDKLLQSIASVLKNSIRENDFVARFGGEEFLVILPDLMIDRGIELAERIRRNIAEELIDASGNTITVSIGVAEMSKNDDIDKVISKADKALYKAKEEGRNRVVCFESGMDLSDPVSFEDR